MLLQSIKLYSDYLCVHSVSLTVVSENKYKTFNEFMSWITPSSHYRVKFYFSCTVTMGTENMRED